jgi:signal peptidase II
MKRLFLILSVAAFLLALDISSKFLVQQHLPLVNGYMGYPFGGIALFENFYGIKFSIVHATNQGAAWGMFSSHPYILLAVRLVVVLYVIGSLIFSKAYRAYAAPLIIICTAALGNVLDFFIYGHVIDMFYFIFWGYSYPIFNVADSIIFCSMGWIFIQSLVKKKRVHENSQS